MTCSSPHPSNPDILCDREAGHEGKCWRSNPGNANRHVWPRETWPRWRSLAGDAPDRPRSGRVLLWLWDRAVAVPLAGDGDALLASATHWMPLPPPPEKP